MKIFVTFLISALALASAANIFLTDLDPEEAAKYIANPPFGSPALSARTNILPLVRYDSPSFRSADAGPTLGHYWKNGKEIQNTDDYIEEVYDASQYHGQDGLGAYGYGYKTPESSKVENRQRSGDLTGSYTYKAPGYGSKDVQVRYWADSQGFHQEDNLPKYVPKQVEEAPEVKAARIAHEKAWNEAAYANLHPGAAAAQAAGQIQPAFGAYQAQPSQGNYQQKGNYQQQGNYQAQPSQNSNQQYQKSYDYQPQASEQQQSLVAAPGQAREGKQYDQNQYQQYSSTTTTTEEPTGPPRGFFYSFNYPVSIVVPKSEAGQNANPGYPVDDDTVSQYGRSQ